MLKKVFTEYLIKQPEWCASVTLVGGFPMSRSAGNQLLNWDRWPKATPANSIIQQTEQFLLSRGVPRHAIANIWQQDNEGSRIPDLTTVREARRILAKQQRAQAAAAAEEKALLIDPIGEPEMLSPNAKKQFSIFRSPFDDEAIAGPEDVFTSDDIRYIRESMYANAKHGGLLAVVGESGGGKSVLRKDLIDRIQREGDQVRIIYPQIIDKTRLSATSISEAILRDLQPDSRMPSSLESRTRMITKQLQASAATGFRHVIIIEEAHDLTITCMKHLKRFHEIEDGFRKLLSIILIGQPELLDKLNVANYPEAREFINRCEVAKLVPLDRNLEGYLAFKFQRVGANVENVLDASAFDAIRKRLTRVSGSTVISNMNPLQVNNLVIKAMNLAAEIGEAKVSADVIFQI
ncbi:ExeA family protein [Methylobacillus flagellatus]|nr:AAA family ATPase [Methylobacillus flagellatus]